MSDNTSHSPKGNPRYVMEYIPDPDLYKAVMFARMMIRQKKPPGVAITRAAKYYGVATADVARHVGKVSGNVRRKRKDAGEQ